MITVFRVIVVSTICFESFVGAFSNQSSVFTGKIIDSFYAVICFGKLTIFT